MSGFLLHLYGPMQSWADNGFGQLREAGEFPSRAAVLGVVAAAMGIPRADDRLLDIHEKLHVHVATVRPGHILRDFHTVETKVGKTRTLTSRDYRYDAHFIALIQGDQSTLAAAESALRSPVYGTFLGRRSCPPALPLLPEVIAGDPFAALRETTISSAYGFPRGDKTWRRGRGESTLTAWLDARVVPSEIPAAFEGAAVSYGTRRARLVGVRRAYSATPFTRLRLPVAGADATGHDTYFHATS